MTQQQYDKPPILKFPKGQPVTFKLLDGMIREGEGQYGAWYMYPADVANIRHTIFAKPALHARLSEAPHHRLLTVTMVSQDIYSLEVEGQPIESNPMAATATAAAPYQPSATPFNPWVDIEAQALVCLETAIKHFQHCKLDAHPEVIRSWASQLCIMAEKKGAVPTHDTDSGSNEIPTETSTKVDDDPDSLPF